MRILSIGECMIELSEAAAGPDLWRMGVAGDTLNTAWYLRRLLPEDFEVAYATRLGTDEFSARILGFLAAAGLDTAFVQRDPARGPGLYAISLKDGERSFTYWRGQSAARHLADEPEVLAEALSGARLAYLSGITLAILAPDRREALLATLKASAVPFAFDPNVRPRLWESPEAARDWVTRAASAAAILLPSADDEAAAFGDASAEATLARYAALGVPEIAVKAGGGPIHWQAEGTAGVAAAHAPVAPVDTTGAGDSFNAGYLAARLTGAGPEAAIAAGHHVAAQVVLARGALTEIAAPVL
ncbi:sugar kinase [Pseudoroseicyclus sp. CXY001]|uniref:sugar kinase n=1 Tax=Pseudoroseicyclus sp. CXY001 TaxID=3242492 RepID=UPI0035712C0A